MSIEFPKSAAAHINPEDETIITKDDGSFEKVNDYNEHEDLNDFIDEHKEVAIDEKAKKKDSVNYDKKRGKSKASKDKRKDYRLN